MDLKVLRKSLVKKMHEYSPEILTGIGIGGFVTAIFMASKAGVEAQELIEERKLDTGKDKLTKREIVETTWKCYVPTAVTAASATACVVGAAAKNRKRYAGLAAAYSLSQETLNLTRQKIVETLGEKKEAEIREEVDKERIKRNPPRPGFEVNPFPPDSLFEYNGRYFCSTWDNVRSAVTQLCEDMLENPYEPSVTENDLFELWGLPYERDKYNVGWHLHINGRPELFPPSCIELPNHQICFVLSFRNPAEEIDTRKIQHI